MSYFRTPEHRARQAELIRRWKPWEHSTGPLTDEGKATVARNADKGGTRAMMRELRRALRDQAEALKNATSTSNENRPCAGFVVCGVVICASKKAARASVFGADASPVLARLK